MNDLDFKISRYNADLLFSFGKDTPARLARPPTALILELNEVSSAGIINMLD